VLLQALKQRLVAKVEAIVSADRDHTARMTLAQTR
jgi:hypothetical protein